MAAILKIHPHSRIPAHARHNDQINLAENQSYHYDLHRGSLEIVGLSGTAWITIEGDPEDYLLAPGEKLEISQLGRIVVEGLPKASFILWR